MSTGVVAVALRLDGRELLSDVLLTLAAALWLALAAWVTVGLATDRARIRREARELRALTGVAATCVLGAGLAALGWTGPAQALLAIGVVLLCCLLPVVAAALPATPGGFVFLLAVATQAVAVLAATLAPRLNAPWEAGARSRSSPWGCSSTSSGCGASLSRSCAAEGARSGSRAGRWPSPPWPAVSSSGRSMTSGR